MKRKAQAAMEYLMTYGWAILIVIIVVAALYAMGVFTATSPVACSPCFGTDFAFVDYASGTLVLTNGASAKTITSVSGGSIDATSECQLNAECEAGDQVKLSGISTSGDVDLSITYTATASGLEHTATGTIHN
ncbi:MAG: hypothetical protein DRO99_01185 [Candidatus Aenigmatarchaeota archaeon]|nr:MAG: hypothetical protein DRO99_01185 [Candidatus Aenigmarchaeota archaeon]